MGDDYAAFLTGKVDFDTRCGFEVAPDEVHPALLPHQRDVVRWAVEGGRRALFEAFGLGKSIQQLEIMRLILAYLEAEDRKADMPSLFDVLDAEAVTA